MCPLSVSVQLVAHLRGVRKGRGEKSARVGLGEWRAARGQRSVLNRSEVVLVRFASSPAPKLLRNHPNWPLGGWLRMEAEPAALTLAGARGEQR